MYAHLKSSFVIMHFVRPKLYSLTEFLGVENKEGIFYQQKRGYSRNKNSCERENKLEEQRPLDFFSANARPVKTRISLQICLQR